MDVQETNIDTLSLGVLVVGAGNRVLMLNAAAEALLATADGLMLRGDVLTATRPFEAEMMRREVASTLVRDGQPVAPSYTVATVSRLSGLAPYLLLIAPLADSLTAGKPGDPAALIAVEDPEQPIPNLSQQLRIAFQIAEGGAEVAAQLLESHGLGKVEANQGVQVRAARALWKALLSDADRSD